jgi:hypothetical protein
MELKALASTALELAFVLLPELVPPNREESPRLLKLMPLLVLLCWVGVVSSPPNRFPKIPLKDPPPPSRRTRTIRIRSPLPPNRPPPDEEDELEPELPPSRVPSRLPRSPSSLPPPELWPELPVGLWLCCWPTGPVPSPYTFL